MDRPKVEDGISDNVAYLSPPSASTTSQSLQSTSSKLEMTTPAFFGNHEGFREAARHIEASRHISNKIGAPEIQVLATRSMGAKSAAYAPYSNFRVGATLLCETGEFIDGANVENAAYPVGTCAERVALGKAVTGGHTKFRAIAVATDVTPPAPPCGMCRQFIREFCQPDTPIFMFDKNGLFIIKTLNELLPYSFGPETLLPERRR